MTEKRSSLCLDVVKRHVPLRVKNKKRNAIPLYRERLMSRRRSAHKHLNSGKKLSNGVKRKLKQKLCDIEKLLMNSYQNQKDFEEKKALEAIKVNPKFFYAYAKKFSKSSSPIGPLLKPGDNELTCDKDMANVLAGQFSSVFCEPVLCFVNL